MSADIWHALRTERTIDITTYGRKSGEPRRIEMWFHNVDDQIFITGLPGRRDWFANVSANPEMIFHLKQSVHADLPAQVRVISESEERQQVFGALAGPLGIRDIQSWMEGSPLIEVLLGSLEE